MFQMVACDSCGLWYHLSCLGMRLRNVEGQDWYCNPCSKRPSVRRSDRATSSISELSSVRPKGRPKESHNSRKSAAKSSVDVKDYDLNLEERKALQGVCDYIGGRMVQCEGKCGKWHHSKCSGVSNMSHEKNWLCDRCDSGGRITPNPISSNDLDDDRPRPQSHSDDISKFRSHSLLDLYALRREGQDDLLRRTANRRRPGGRSVSPVSSPATS